MPKWLLHHIEKWAAPWSVGIGGLMLFFDYLTGPYIQFPILFVFPVALLAWYRPCRWAIMLAAFLCAVRQAISLRWWEDMPTTISFDLSIIFINSLIRLVVLFLVALLISRLARQRLALEAQVQTLVGILPVCGYCKKIRNEEEKWEPIESFISRHSDARFSHSVCPDCGQEHYPQFCEPPVPRGPVTRTS
jgi:hypothetical protein